MYFSTLKPFSCRRDTVATPDVNNNEANGDVLVGCLSVFALSFSVLLYMLFKANICTCIGNVLVARLGDHTTLSINQSTSLSEGTFTRLAVWATLNEPVHF